MEYNLVSHELEKKRIDYFKPDTAIEQLIVDFQVSQQNSIMHCVNVIFKQLNLDFTIENFKRITKAYPQKPFGPEKYFLDFGTPSEILLFEVHTEFSEPSSVKMNATWNIKSNFDLNELNK